LRAKAGVDSSVRVESGETIGLQTAGRVEIAADQKLTVRLSSNGEDVSYIGFGNKGIKSLVDN
jgi:hypothetical protein